MFSSCSPRDLLLRFSPGSTVLSYGSYYAFTSSLPVFYRFSLYYTGFCTGSCTGLATGLTTGRRGSTENFSNFESNLADPEAWGSEGNGLCWSRDSDPFLLPSFGVRCPNAPGRKKSLWPLALNLSTFLVSWTAKLCWSYEYGPTALECGSADTPLTGSLTVAAQIALSAGF